jgi:hypothetical protein
MIIQNSDMSTSELLALLPPVEEFNKRYITARTEYLKAGIEVIKKVIKETNGYSPVTALVGAATSEIYMFLLEQKGYKCHITDARPGDPAETVRLNIVCPSDKELFMSTASNQLSTKPKTISIQQPHAKPITTTSNEPRTKPKTTTSSDAKTVDEPSTKPITTTSSDVKTVDEPRTKPKTAASSIVAGSSTSPNIKPITAASSIVADSSASPNIKPLITPDTDVDKVYKRIQDDSKTGDVSNLTVSSDIWNKLYSRLKSEGYNCSLSGMSDGTIRIIVSKNKNQDDLEKRSLTIVNSTVEFFYNHPEQNFISSFVDIAILGTVVPMLKSLGYNVKLGTLRTNTQDITIERIDIDKEVERIKNAVRKNSKKSEIFVDKGISDDVYKRLKAEGYDYQIISQNGLQVRLVFHKGKR